MLASVEVNTATRHATGTPTPSGRRGAARADRHGRPPSAAVSRSSPNTHCSRAQRRRTRTAWHRTSIGTHYSHPTGHVVYVETGKTADQVSYSHSIVPGGLLVMSSTTRLTSRTSLVMRVEIRASTSNGTRDQSAVIASSDDTGLSTIGWP